MSKTKKQKSPLREWGDALLFAVVAASLIRWLLLEPFTIPTASMEKSLLVGDFLFVSKMHYGSRFPQTPVQMPLTHQKIWGTEIPSYTDKIRLPYFRLPGFTSVKRNDVVVFNYPVEFEHPSDLKTNYIKRAVAVAGDEISIKHTQIYIDGKPVDNPEEMQFSYDVMSSRPLSADFFDEYGINPESFYPFSSGQGYMVFASEKVAQALEQNALIQSVDKRVEREGAANRDIFPQAPDRFEWNKDNFGPLKVPAKGWTIPVNEENLALYGSTIRDYERHKEVSIQGNELLINGEKVTEYTFKQDYYFMMGDNRHDSLDSRYWGFVPEDHVVGKAWFLWLSLDKHKSAFSKVRWNRIFSGIK